MCSLRVCTFLSFPTVQRYDFVSIPQFCEQPKSRLLTSFNSIMTQIYTEPISPTTQQLSANYQNRFSD